MKLGSSRGMDTKRPRGSERSKPCHQLRLTRRSLPPYPWPPEQAQPGVSKPCRTTLKAAGRVYLTVPGCAERTLRHIDDTIQGPRRSVVENELAACRRAVVLPCCAERHGAVAH